MQRFGLSDLIGASQEEALSSQILSSCLVSNCRGVFLMVLSFHIHLTLSHIIALSRIFSFVPLL